MRLALDRGCFILGQRGPAGAQVTTVNRRGVGGGERLWGCMLCMSNQMSTCVTGFSLFSRPEWPMSGFRKSKRNRGRERNNVCSQLRKEKKKGKNFWALDFCLRLESNHSYARVATNAQSSLPDDKGGKFEVKKIQKQCPPSRVDWKAAKSNYDCENVQTPRFSSQQTS